MKDNAPAINCRSFLTANSTSHLAIGLRMMHMHTFRFDMADMRNAVLDGAILIGASFRSARMRGARLNGANLERVCRHRRVNRLH